MRRSLFVFASLLSFATPAAAASFGAPLSDLALARERGGFDLPNGLQVNLAVVSNNMVNGQTVLRTIYMVEGNSTTLSVLAPDGSGGLVPVSNAQAGNAQLSQIPGGSRVQFTSNGTQIANLIGNAIGTVVDNRTDNQTIDVQTTVDLRIAGATAQNLGSAVPRIEDLALSSVALLSH